MHYPVASLAAWWSCYYITLSTLSLTLSAAHAIFFLISPEQNLIPVWTGEIQYNLGTIMSPFFFRIDRFRFAKGY